MKVLELREYGKESGQQRRITSPSSSSPSSVVRVEYLMGTARQFLLKMVLTEGVGQRRLYRPSDHRVRLEELLNSRQLRLKGRVLPRQKGLLTPVTDAARDAATDTGGW